MQSIPVIVIGKLKLPLKSAKTEIFVLFLVTQCMSPLGYFEGILVTKKYFKNFQKPLDKYIVTCYYIRVRVQK